MADIVKKIEMRTKGDGTYNELLYPKTSVDMVIGAETPAGAQAKANTAEANAKAASVPIGRTINGAPLSANISLNYTNVGAVNAIFTGATTADPNTTQESYILTNHANSPGDGRYWHIQTYFYNGRTGNRAQQAIEYNPTNMSEPRMFIRSYFSSWGAWREVTGGGSMPIMVASNTLQHSFNTVRTFTATSGSNYIGMLVGKFVPEGTGEIRVTAELEASNSSSSYGTRLTVLGRYGEVSYNPAVTYSGNQNISWLSSLGTTFGKGSVAGGTQIVTSTNESFTSVTGVVTVIDAVPLYIIMENYGNNLPSGSVTSCRNVRVYYDIVK